jgi:hypothetical protein
MELSNARCKTLPFRGRLSPVALSLLMAFPVWGEELAKSEENIETTAVEEIAANDPDDYARNVVEFEDDLLRMMGHNKVDLERFTLAPAPHRANTASAFLSMTYKWQMMRWSSRRRAISAFILA